ncbi:hypothetical protein ACIHEJ_35140 [Streptomyces sp. NPDC052301]|uniref:AraC-like ligand-binding domain-containing protein n=1 Tax=Streptomyces sp. NPDC052301 TaxID=3365687 RepID=UPI0037CDAD3A
MRTDDFRGGMILQRADAYQLVECWSDTVGYTRAPRQVRQDPDEDYRFLLPLTGETVLRQGDEESRLTPRAAGLMTCSAPFELLPAQTNRVAALPTRDCSVHAV